MDSPATCPPGKRGRSASSSSLPRAAMVTRLLDKEEEPQRHRDTEKTKTESKERMKKETKRRRLVDPYWPSCSPSCLLSVSVSLWFNPPLPPLPRQMSDQRQQRIGQLVAGDVVHEILRDHGVRAGLAVDGDVGGIDDGAVDTRSAALQADRRDLVHAATRRTAR